MISNCRLLTAKLRQYENLQIHRTICLILFGAQDNRCNKHRPLTGSACVTVHGSPVGPLPEKSKNTAGRVVDDAGLMPGNAGQISTAAGGQTSSSIRRFLTEFSYLFLTFLMCPILYRFAGKNVPITSKNVPVALEKMYRSMSKNVPAYLARAGKGELSWTC